MLNWILGILCAFLVFLTLLPLSKNPRWWVRGADFPRFQLVALGLGLLAATLAASDFDGRSAGIIVATTSACIVYQAWWVLPFTRLYNNEVKTAAPDGRLPRVRIMSANVLQTNRRSGDLLRIVRGERPDVLVTLETNAWWERELEILEAEYPHTLKCPLENLYGMHLYSRFPIEDAKIQFLVEPDVPSMHLLVVLPGEVRVRLHCLHPAPPSPTENPTSKERDAELVMVGRSVAKAELPVIVSGDLNDVAWSATTRLFRKVSGLLDPRVGRGMFNTFHARYPFCRWPVDHIFHSYHFTVVRLARLGYCGSDHFPVLIELAVDPSAPHRQQGLAADADDKKEAREKMREEGVATVEVHQPGRSGASKPAGHRG